MDYFILKQDRDLENAVKIDGFNNSQKMILKKEDADKFKDCTDVPVTCNENTVFPDLVEAPVLMISDELYKLFNSYDKTIIYKIAVFSSIKMKLQKVYRLVLPDIIDALSDETTYLKNGWVDHMVLDKEKIGKYNIFRVKAGVDYYFVVSLDVAESILKRDFIGIKFKRVEVI